YLASAVLKRYDDEGRHEADLPLVHWGVQDALYRAEQAMDDLLYPGMWDEALEEPYDFCLVQSFLFEDRNRIKRRLRVQMADLAS
ncbi:DUF1974 domain-containing protein, partial [Salmonella enterica subsp. enterica serovar Montevideo]|nr:DUF1974 domain-containing protein [Salmonella enterica subsp. enterica serovar Montevideo]